MGQIIPEQNLARAKVKTFEGGETKDDRDLLNLINVRCDFNWNFKDCRKS